MHKTNPINIDYISQLARIELSDSEKKKFSEQIIRDVESFCEILSVNVDGIEPMSHAFPLYSDAWLSDIVEKPLDIEAALQNAPQQYKNYITVPRVIE